MAHSVDIESVNFETVLAYDNDLNTLKENLTMYTLGAKLLEDICHSLVSMLMLRHSHNQFSSKISSKPGVIRKYG